MFITALGTAVPPRSFTQSDCWDALQRADRPELTPRTRDELDLTLTEAQRLQRPGERDSRRRVERIAGIRRARL